MPKTGSLAPLLEALNDLKKWFDAAGVPGVVIGGVAASLLGRPRVTRNVDALILLDNTKWRKFLDSGVAFNFSARLPDVLEFARQSRVFLLKHIPSGIDIDISCGLLPFEENCIKNAQRISAGGIDILIPSPEDLIILKAVAHRPIDLMDIEAIVKVQGELNERYINRKLAEFAAILEMPEIRDDVKAIFKRVKKS